MRTTLVQKILSSPKFLPQEISPTSTCTPPLDNFIQHLVTGVFAEGQEIEIGYINNRSSRSNSLNSLSGLNRFLIERIETLPRPEFKENMRFICLSPITVSKVSCPTLEKGGEGGFIGSSDSLFALVIISAHGKNGFLRQLGIIL